MVIHYHGVLVLAACGQNLHIDHNSRTEIYIDYFSPIPFDSCKSPFILLLLKLLQNIFPIIKQRQLDVA